MRWGVDEAERNRMAGTAEKRAEEPGGRKRGLFMKSTKGGNCDERESLGSWYSGRPSSYPRKLTFPKSGRDELT